MKKTKVIGLGNDILTDDGIGTRIVQDLHRFFKNHGIDNYTTPEGSLDILEEVKGYDNLIVIDADITKKKKPGEISFLKFPLRKPTLHLSGLHDVNFNDMIKLLKEMNVKVPDRISVISVEIVEDKIFSKNFSEQIQRKYLSIIQIIKKYIIEFVSDNCDA